LKAETGNLLLDNISACGLIKSIQNTSSIFKIEIYKDVAEVLTI
jgi:hypothetical protein